MSARVVVHLTAAALLACAAACNSSAGPPAEAGKTPAPAPARPSDPPVAPAADAAQPPDAPLADHDRSVWHPRYDWSLEVDGKPADEARFFVDHEAKKVLVHLPALPRAAVLDLPSRQVTTLGRDAVALDAATDTARVPPEAQGGTASSFSVEGAQVLFYLGNNRLKITPKQPLEGPASRETIFRHTPVYRKAMEEYAPEPAEVSFLRSYGSEVEIVVFFGTWCPHCKVLVPRFMKAVDQASNPRIKVSYVGVPRNFGQYDPARSRGVTGVPSFIFYRGGREFGRIPGDPTGMSIEKAVAETLRTGGA